MPPITHQAVQRIPVADIEVANGCRGLQPSGVTHVAVSIARIGMLSPIGVRMVDGNFRLVYGRHRLAAVRSLGWTDIECHMLEADDRRVRMAEITENLHRAELSELERSEQVADWLKLAAEDADDKPVQVAQISSSRGGRSNRGGLSEAAREIGITREAARRAQKVAALLVEARIAAEDLGLADNQSALVKAAKSPDPVASLRQHAIRPRRSQGQTTPEENPPKKTALRELFSAWNRANRNEKRLLLGRAGNRNLGTVLGRTGSLKL